MAKTWLEAGYASSEGWTATIFLNQIGNRFESAFRAGSHPLKEMDHGDTFATRVEALAAATAAATKYIREVRANDGYLPG